MTKVATARDYRAIAKARLPHFLFEYYDGASFDGVTARANEKNLASVKLRQRVLVDVSNVSTRTTFLNEYFSMPVGLSPVGLAGMAARRGELLAAKAAATRKVPFVLSTTSVCRLDEVATNSVPWFQLYLVRDRDFVKAMLEWATELGCTTVVLTVDLPVLGLRWRDYKSGLKRQG